jgi:hypothetical protein
LHLDVNSTQGEEFEVQTKNFFNWSGRFELNFLAITQGVTPKGPGVNDELTMPVAKVATTI